MKLDILNLQNKYINLSKESMQKNMAGSSVIGPIKGITYNADSGFIALDVVGLGNPVFIDVNEHDETTDVELVTEYLWKALLYEYENRVVNNS